jgi:hypothetical protein
VVASSPYTADEKFGLQQQQPAHSPTFTPNSDGIPKEYTDNPLSYTDMREKAVPVRKYSIELWKKIWNKAVEGRIWPRVVYGSIFLIIMAVWLGAM